MRRVQACIVVVGCLFVMTVSGVAQTRKPGLWELTTSMTWQQSPLPPGMAGGEKSPFSSGVPHTTQVCLTQQQIDKYGAILPTTSGCTLTNLVKKSSSMTAEMVCTGKMSGKGTLESSWTDDDHAVGKIHFVGSMQMGPNSKPIEWTTASHSVFKGADCGSVKPYLNMPEK